MKLSPEHRAKIKQHLKHLLLIKSWVLLVLWIQYLTPRVQQSLFANSFWQIESWSIISSLPNTTSVTYQGIAEPGYQWISLESTQQIVSWSNTTIWLYTIHTNQSVSVISWVAMSWSIISVSISGWWLIDPLVLSSIVSNEFWVRSVVLPQALDPSVVGSQYDIIVSVSPSTPDIHSLYTGRQLSISIPHGIVIDPLYSQYTETLITTTTN